MRRTGIFAVLGLTLGLLAGVTVAAGQDRAGGLVRLAQAPHGMAPETPMPTQAEARMQRRFPQPVRVGDLIGLPVLDDNDATLGRVREVVRDPQGKIKLIVGYSKWWGWGGHPVAVPIEVVAILGRQIAALDMPREEFASAPTWTAAGGRRPADSGRGDHPDRDHAALSRLAAAAPFLLVKSHSFDAIRRTCGAWIARTWIVDAAAADGAKNA